MSMMLGSAIITTRTPRGTVYRSEALISRTVSGSMDRVAAANVRECPDCGHAAYHHTAAGCLASNGVGPICLCDMPRDDVDSHHEDHQERD